MRRKCAVEIDKVINQKLTIFSFTQGCETNPMKIFRRLLLTAAFAGLIAILIPVFTDRRDYAADVDRYENNPTLDNAVIMMQEHEKNRRLAFLTRLGAGTVLFVVLNLGWMLATLRPAPSGSSDNLDV